MLLIVGRTGSGKDTYAKELERLGLKGICSYTTRPRRQGEGDTHIFIKESEVNDYPDKIAITNINGYTYFATVQQFKKADFYIIDPDGIDYLNKNFPELDYRIVYIYADYQVRRERVVNRVFNAEAQLLEGKVFVDRNQSEDGQFSGFENSLYKKNVIIHNNTDMSADDLKKCALQDAMILTNADIQAKINKLFT